MKYSLLALLVIASLLPTPVLAVTAAHVKHVVLPPSPSAPILPKVPDVARGYRAPNAKTTLANVTGITSQPFVGLSLEDAIGMALAKNPNVQIARANVRIARYQIVAASGAYDVHFQIAPSVSYSKQPPTNSFFAGPNFGPIVQNQQTLAGGIGGALAGGQTYSVSVSSSRVDNNTVFNTFNPYYPSNLSVSFMQPILRGAAIDSARKGYRLAVIGSDVTSAQALANASQTLGDVENTYWDLVAAWRNVAIRESALRQAVVQQRSNLRLAKSGAAAPIEAVESSTQVSIFQENVFVALQSVVVLQNRLKGLLVSDPSDPIWRANLVPTSPVLRLPTVAPLNELVKMALANRPEMREAIDARRSADVQYAFAHDQLKPQVDLTLGYQTNGFAGSQAPTNPFTLQTVQQDQAIDALIVAVNKTLPPAQQIPLLAGGNTPTPAYLTGGLSQSITNLLENRFPTYSATINVSLPFGNRTAKGLVGIAKQQERIANIQEAGTISRIVVDVQNAVQNYQTALASLAAARSARQASEAVYASEVRKFKNGVSTTFLVLQRQVQLAESRGLELQAQTNLNKAVVGLEQATGSILSINHISVDNIGKGTGKK